MLLETRDETEACTHSDFTVIFSYISVFWTLEIFIEDFVIPSLFMQIILYFSLLSLMVYTFKSIFLVFFLIKELKEHNNVIYQVKSF